MGAPAIIIHSLDQAAAAITAAAEIRCEVLLLSSRNAASSMGAGVFHSLIELARVSCPSPPFAAALDCGSNAGHALAALRQGIQVVVLADECPARQRVADIARQNGAQLLSDDVYGVPGVPAPLDLLDHPDPLAACRVFLHTGTAATSQQDSRVLQ